MAVGVFAVGDCYFIAIVQLQVGVGRFDAVDRCIERVATVLFKDLSAQGNEVAGIDGQSALFDGGLHGFGAVKCVFGAVDSHVDGRGGRAQLRCKHNHGDEG